MSISSSLLRRRFAPTSGGNSDSWGYVWVIVKAVAILAHTVYHLKADTFTLFAGHGQVAISLGSLRIEDISTVSLVI